MGDSGGIACGANWSTVRHRGMETGISEAREGREEREGESARARETPRARTDALLYSFHTIYTTLSVHSQARETGSLGLIGMGLREGEKERETARARE